jgi:pyruvate dehydrogenase E1 component alpha subunit
VAQVRESRSPVFLEARTFRFRAHSMYDPDRYREKSEIEQWRHRDPLLVLAERMRAEGSLTDDDVAAMEQQIAAEIDDAVEFAEQSGVEPVEDLARFVHTGATDGGAS